MHDLEYLTARDVRESYLTPDEVDAVRRPVEEATVPPLRIYSSRAFYEREVEAVHRRHWHAVARVDQLSEAGSFVTADVVGEPVLVMRDKDGTIRALSNVCRHRGAQLLTGCGVAKAVICPYHTWTYNLDGRLRGAPHMGASQGFDRKEIRLPEFRMEIWNGFVFVNFDPDAEPLAGQVTGLTEKLAPYQLDKWVSAPWMERTFDWNWKISMENFTEAYHHIGVHQHSIGKSSPAEKTVYEDTNNNYSLFHVYIEEDENAPHDYPFVPTPNLPASEDHHSPVFNIYPTFHMVLAPNFALWLRFEITGTREHKMIWRWMTPEGSDALPDYADRLKVLEEFMGQIVAEDIGFLPRIRAAVDSQAFVPGRYCAQERAVHQMHLWLLREMERYDALTAPERVAPQADRVPVDA